MITYKAFIKLSLKHEYYAQSAGAGISFKPALDSAQIIDNAGLIIKSSGFELSVYGTQKSEPILQELAAQAAATNEELQLSFLIFASDPMFREHSLHSPRINQQAWFVSNASQYQQTAFELQQSTALGEAQCEALNQQALANIPHLQHEPFPAIALVQISIQSVLLALQGNAPISFTLNIRAAQFRWKYLIHSSSAQSFAIRDKRQQHQFSFMGEELVNNQTLQCYLSENSIALTQRSEQQFELLVNEEDTQHVLLSRLPVASNTSKNIQQLETEQIVVSEIFVYL